MQPLPSHGQAHGILMVLKEGTSQETLCALSQDMPTHQVPRNNWYQSARTQRQTVYRPDAQSRRASVQRMSRRLPHMPYIYIHMHMYAKLRILIHTWQGGCSKWSMNKARVKIPNRCIPLYAHCSLFRLTDTHTLTPPPASASHCPHCRRRR